MLKTGLPKLAALHFSFSSVCQKNRAPAGAKPPVMATQYLANLTVDKSVANIHAATVNNKKTQQTQLVRLGVKADEDFALLDAIRSFLRQRADIEQDYSQKLDRLSKQFSQTWGTSAGGGKRARRFSTSRPMSVAGGMPNVSSTEAAEEPKSST
jgi:hypothetical protein